MMRQNRTPDLAAKANRRAQRRFRAMVTAHVYADPTDHRTVLYTQAERLLDTIRGDEAEFELDAAHDAADWRYAVMTGDYAAGVELPDVPLAFTVDLGDHFAGMAS